MERTGPARHTTQIRLQSDSHSPLIELSLSYNPSTEIRRAAPSALLPTGLGSVAVSARQSTSLWADCLHRLMDRRSTTRGYSERRVEIFTGCRRVACQRRPADGRRQLVTTATPVTVSSAQFRSVPAAPVRHVILSIIVSPTDPQAISRLFDRLRTGECLDRRRSCHDHLVSSGKTNVTRT